MDMAQDRDRWRAIVNAAMNIPLPLNAGNSMTCPLLTKDSGHGVSTSY